MVSDRICAGAVRVGQGAVVVTRLPVVGAAACWASSCRSPAAPRIRGGMLSSRIGEEGIDRVRRAAPPDAESRLLRDAEVDLVGVRERSVDPRPEGELPDACGERAPHRPARAGSGRRAPGEPRPAPSSRRRQSCPDGLSGQRGSASTPSGAARRRQGAAGGREGGNGAGPRLGVGSGIGLGVRGRWRRRSGRGDGNRRGFWKRLIRRRQLLRTRSGLAAGSRCCCPAPVREPLTRVPAVSRAPAR